MDKATHDEPIENEELAMEAGFDGTDVSPVIPETPNQEPAQQDELINQKPVQQDQASLKEPEKAITRADLQAILDRNALLEQQIKKVSDDANGRYGGLKQQLDDVKKVWPRLNPKAREDLNSEFPELAKMLFGGDEETTSVPQVQQQSVVPDAQSDRTREEKFEKRLLSRDHRDWETVVATPDFHQWLTTLPPQEQQQLANSWDADYVSEKLTQFKKYDKTRKSVLQDKQGRQLDLKKSLLNAVQPKGANKGHPPNKEVLDEETAMELSFQGKI